MQFTEVLRTLEAAGSAQTRKTYTRHGVAEPMYGVSYAVLRPLAKRIGANQKLAEQLWATGNFDCRALATLIADPATVKRSTLTAWTKSANIRCLASDFARLVARSPHAVDLASKWCASKKEGESASGWSVVAVLAMEDDAADLDELLAASLDVIEATIDAAPNYTRYAMNGALIAIGGRNAALKKRALAVAKAIGKVEVDHGDTDCKTPDAAAYIAKIWKRKK
jgi:3-methyladenine DNA glycosylase AlkD